MIRYVLFNEKGSVKKGSQEYPKPGKNEYLFLSLHLSNKDEINKVSADFSLNKKALHTFAKEMHPRTYMKQPWQFVIGSSYIDQEKIEFTNLLFAMTDTTLIITIPKDAEYYHKIVDTIYEECKNSQIASIGAILNKFLQAQVEENYLVLAKTEEKIKRIEIKVAELHKEPEVRTDDIVFMKTVLFRLSKQFWATVRAVSLIKIGVPQVRIDTESARLLADYQETLRHNIDIISGQKEMLSDALSLYTTGIATRVAEKSHEVHKVLKMLTAYGLVVLTPALVIGKFSLNIDDLPLVANPWGFYIATGLIAGIFLSVIVYAKRRKWI